MDEHFKEFEPNRQRPRATRSCTTDSILNRAIEYARFSRIEECPPANTGRMQVEQN